MELSEITSLALNAVGGKNKRNLFHVCFGRTSETSGLERSQTKLMQDAWLQELSTIWEVVEFEPQSSQIKDLNTYTCHYLSSGTWHDTPFTPN